MCVVLTAPERLLNAGHSPSGDYPLADSIAAQMLADGIRRADQERGISQRQAALSLGYKQSAVLSHMANGRVPIPIDRALELAQFFGIDRASFLRAVLEQRHPQVDFELLLMPSSVIAGRPQAKSDALEELEAIAGRPLEEIPAEQMRVVKEALSDRDASRRWLSVNELALIELIRRRRPDVARVGLSRPDRDKIERALGVE
jgi:hypothetical protein